jgi:hypothetical protein
VTDRRLLLALGAGIVVAAAIAAQLGPTPSSAPGPAASPVAAATITSGSVSPAGLPPTGPAATAGPPAGFDRFTWEQGYFDYPATWQFYRHIDPARASYAFHGGFLTSHAIDEAVACGTVLGQLGCDPEAVELGPGDALVEIVYLAHVPWAGDIVRGWTDPRFDPTTVAGVPAIMYEWDRPTRHEIAWNILNGRDLSNSLEIRIKVGKTNARPALEQVDGIIDSLTFVPPIEPVDPGKGPAVAAEAVRALRETGPGYECFAEALDIETRMEVSNIGGYGLRQPIAVTCLTTIEATPINFWRLRLTAHWEAEAARNAGEMVITQWLAFDGTPSLSSNRHATPPYCCT